jgi:hypothetical protein
MIFSDWLENRFIRCRNIDLLCKFSILEHESNSALRIVYYTSDRFGTKKVTGFSEFFLRGLLVCNTTEKK